MITQKLSNIRNYDNILFIENGHLVEQGTHNQLIQNRGYYYDLYMNQF